METKAILLEHEDCPVCGDNPTLYTKARQCYGGIAAVDGDEIKCLDCGFVGYASMDEEGWSFAYDETSPHNLQCADRWERAQDAKRSNRGDK